MRSCRTVQSQTLQLFEAVCNVFRGVNFTPTMRTKFLTGILVAIVSVGAHASDDLASQPNQPETKSAPKNIIKTTVHSARLGEIDADTPIYHSYSNAEITDKLNQIDLLSAYERREILLEVRRRIERDGEFKVEEHERRFGHVVSAEPRSTEDTEELLLEEVVIHRVDTGEDMTEVVRDIEPRNSRPPVRRVNSGRAYSSQQ